MTTHTDPSQGSPAHTTDALAIHGGRPVRPADRRWPSWPVAPPDAHELLSEVLDGGRWSLSTPGDRELFEQRFARAFASYVGVRHCVPVDHGSSALVLALEALGLDHGATVLVPALAWVACASSVFRAGLVPLLVDVDRDTGCVGPDAVDENQEAGAVIAVHLACVMADIPALLRSARSPGMAVLEDAAQAHGARWLDSGAGSMGRLGCFSMHQSKVLGAGEGGAVVTDDAALAATVEELRADSRRYPPKPLGGGRIELVETAASMMGANFCLDELNAALLCAQLAQLDDQHARRNANHDLLASLLADVDGVRLVRPRDEQARMSIYEASIVFDPLPGGLDNDEIAGALTAELGVLFYPPRPPLHRSRLLRPWTKPSIGPLSERFRQLHDGRRYPNADYLARHAVLTHHRTFLGSEEDMADLAKAIIKIAAFRHVH